MAAYLFFAFVLFGSKLLLALVTIYLLLPTDAHCNRCDGETLLIRMNSTGRFVARLALRRIQWRWCPSCGWEGMSRVIRRPDAEARVPEQLPTHPWL